VSSMEHLIATWIVKVWQNRRLGEHAPPWAPDERHSPNTLFAASFAQGGFGLRIPSPDLYYGVLPASYVSIPRKRGVKILGLWYDGPALDDYRGKPSPRQGRHPGKWRIRRDPRDRREVFFEDPASGDWHALRWNGLPPEGDVPAFSDARVDELMAEAARCGLTPRNDQELLPVLLEILGNHVTVDQWPGRKAKDAQGKRGRARQSREEHRAEVAERDRNRPRQAPEPAGSAEVVPLRREQVRSAVDADRRRRRERAVPSAPPPPGALGSGYRARDPFLLPPDEEDFDE
jgi:hypothetical protein